MRKETSRLHTGLRSKTLGWFHRPCSNLGKPLAVILNISTAHLTFPLHSFLKFLRKMHDAIYYPAAVIQSDTWYRAFWLNQRHWCSVQYLESQTWKILFSITSPPLLGVFWTGHITQKYTTDAQTAQGNNLYRYVLGNAWQENRN